jgi:hypothetical protein
MTNKNMETTHTVWTVQNISNRKLRAVLRKLGACDRAMEFIGKQDARTAWENCENTEWIEWLIQNANGALGLPVYAKWNPEYDAVNAKWKPEYDAVNAKWKSERDAVNAKILADLKALIAFADIPE